MYTTVNTEAGSLKVGDRISFPPIGGTGHISRQLSPVDVREVLEPPTPIGVSEVELHTRDSHGVEHTEIMSRTAGCLAGRR